MDRSIARFASMLGGFAALLAGLASAAGVLLRGDLATQEVVTVRGEVVQLVTEGIYRFNADAIVAEGVGWDLVTTLVVVPATLMTLLLVRGGSLRATLVAAGLLTYLCYQSAQYAVFWALGPLYPVYVATLALSVSALGLLLYGLDLGRLRVREGRAFPRRAVVGFSLAVMLILVGLWLPVVVGTWGATTVEQLEGAATLVVPAFDLGLLVPLAVFTAIAAFRALPIGYLLGSIVLVKGATMGLAIVAMLVVEGMVTGELALPPLVVFMGAALAAVAIGVRALGSLGDEGTASPAIDASLGSVPALTLSPPSAPLGTTPDPR